MIQYQTPVEVISYMCSMIPEGSVRILEPTPGNGRIVKYLRKYDVTAPKDFFKMEKDRFDCIVMNPPFSTKTGFGIPTELNLNGMRLGYYILDKCMEMSNHLIALMPWFTILDSDKRSVIIKKFGLRSITALPRKTFDYARIQTCILELDKGFQEETIFKVYSLIK